MGPRSVVVLDSNVLVSALGWRGAPHEVYGLCRSGDLSLVTSPLLLDELGRVLRYPKFEFPPTEITRFLAEIEIHSKVVFPAVTLDRITDDPADNRVLECAIQGRADWIVSGDEHLLALRQFEDIRIGSAPDLLDWLSSQRSAPP